MKTKTVRVDELEGEALRYVYSRLCFSGELRSDGVYGRASILCKARQVYGPTVEVPAELVEGV